MTRLELGFSDDFIHTKKPIRYEDNKDRRITTDTVTAYWKGKRIRVKPGFAYDGASIPRLFWRIIGNPWERYEAAALVHDILYASKALPRKQCDDCFRDLMEWIGVKKWRLKLMYKAVRTTGGRPWKRYTKESIADAKQYLEID